MRAGSPIDAVAASVHHACLVQLLPEEHPEVEWTKDPDPETGSRRRETGRIKKVRPDVGRCEVTMFLQVWGSTALGFGGIGGQAMTPAYTVVVVGPRGDACVYFAGRFAYHILRPSGAFNDDLQRFCMSPRKGASERYETHPDQGGV